jgi:hypothetical protein
MNDPGGASTSPARELFAEQLLGREVRDSRDEVVGRIVDIRAGDESGDFVVRHYIVGPVRSSARLSLDNVAARLLALLGVPLGGRSYEVPWRDMDLSDPRRPRVRREKGSLRVTGMAG